MLEFGILWLYLTEFEIATPSPNQRIITKATNDHFT